MEAFIGDYIRTKNHHNTGKVYRKHISFASTSETDSWFANLRPALPEDTKKEPWYSILCSDNGSILVPESDIVEVSDHPIGGKYENIWDSFHFRDNKTAVRTILYGAEAQSFYSVAILELELRNDKKILTDNTTCLKVATGGYWLDTESNLFFAFDNWSHDLTVEEFDSEEEASKYAYGILATTKDKVEI
jgi:hypothetical protein